MAALVASPPVSPLASPSLFFPEHREEQPGTTALVNDVLAALASQQPRTTGWDRHLQFEEPSSYPFPPLPDVSYLEGPQGFEYSELSSVDFSAFVVQPDLAAPASNHSDNVTFDAIEDSLNYYVASTQPVLPVACCPDSTGASLPGQEPNIAPFLSVTDEGISTQGILSVSNDGNVQNASSGPSLKAFNRGSEPQVPPERATETHLQSEFTGSLTSPVFSLAPTPRARSVAFDWTAVAPGDEHYSNESARKRPKTKELRHNNKHEFKDQKGSVIGSLITLGYDRVVRQPYSEAERAQTKITRQRGACYPCRISKKRCNRPESEYECCSNCRTKVLFMPCFVAKIIDAQLFRDKPSPKHPLGALRPDVFKSLSDISHVPQRQRPIIVNLTQDLGPQMLVVLARYNPLAKEVTHRVWKKDEQTRHIELPPYCIANMKDAQRHMLEYIANFRSAWLKNVLGRSNDITRSLFDQAQRFAAFNPDSTVSKALDLCAASRIIERDWRICGGPADLGIPLISDDETNPFFNRMPITPMMDAQLDQIVIRSFLIPTREALLSSLQAKMTSSTKSSSYFEIFLTVSVLLSHAEWLLEHSRQNARRVGAKTRYNYIPRAEAYFHACNTIIAYWHYMCQGTCPAEMKWMDEAARKWAGLDQEQAQFLEGLKMRINANDSKSMMLRLREENRYETELYWCHQLFFPNWKAGAKVVMDEVMTM